MTRSGLFSAQPGLNGTVSANSVDLDAEQVVAAEKAGQRITVEVKSFTGPSKMSEVDNALGQYVVCHSVLTRTEPDRALYLRNWF